MSSTCVRFMTVVGCARAALAGGTPLMLATKSRYSDDRHVRIERRRLRQIAGAALGFDRLVEDVEARDDRLAFRGRHVAGQNAHGRRLARAVWAEEAENLASLDTEAEIV